MRYPNASTEDLETIRANECEAGDGSLATKRFQRLWNEIEDLRKLAYGRVKFDVKPADMGVTVTMIAYAEV